jgi:AcrR family transcriptional regulator
MATRTHHRPAKAASQPARGRPPLDAGERRRILDATTSVFLDRGFQRASTAEIVRRARTSKQTLYALFPTKADLFTSVVSAYTETLFSRHMEYIESGKPPAQALTEMGDMVLDLFSSPTFLALYRIVVAEAENFPALARQLWLVCGERGYVLLSKYLKSRGIGGPAWRKSAAQFVSMILGDFVLNAMLNPDHAPSRRLLRLRVREAVRDFLLLHAVPAHQKQTRKQGRKQD